MQNRKKTIKVPVLPVKTKLIHKKMKKKIAIILLICPVVVFAQQIAVHSPTAANLGLYGEIPVSYYTGTPNISIPLYEIKGKQITIPVRLSYHPAGIRPEIHPGPVGLGWSLQAGGVISRTVRGNGPDENQRENRSGMVEGYLSYTGGWIAQSNWKDNAKNGLNNNCFACSNTVHNMAPYSDLEPDEFSFSVLNISGKFYFDHTGQIQVQCDNPVEVIFNNEFIRPDAAGISLDYSYSMYSNRAFKSFTIIDEQGTEYHFGGASAMEFSDPISYGNNGNNFGIPATGEFLQATSWFLTQIKSADEVDVINFEYERGPFVSQLYRSYNYYSYSGAGMSGTEYNSITKDGTLISPVYLKRIARVNGEDITFSYTQSNDIKYSYNDYNAVFQYASSNDYKLLEMTSAIPRFQSNVPSNKFDRIQWLKLDAIFVKKTVNESLRQINFVYNNNSSERLFLDSVKIYGNETLLTPPMKYAFTYKNKSRLPAQYLTCITDHWGFNNGKPYSSSFNSQSKAPDAYYTDSGVLSEIRYPTGGATQFEYELNDYAKVVNTKNRSVVTSQSGTASGLRIKKIITDNIVREFFYRETPTSSVSSGILNMLPQYTYSINGTDCSGYSFNKSVTRSMPVIPLTKDNEGLYIGYTYVCERPSDGNGGYTQYHYTNHDNGHSDSLLANGTWNRNIFPTDPHCSRYFERGRLIKETVYNAGGQTVAVNETVWFRAVSRDGSGSEGDDYNSRNNSSITSSINPRAFLFEGIPIGYCYCSSAAYLHYCYKFLPSQKKEIVYDFNGQNPVTTTTNYSYNTANLLSETNFVRSDGKTQTTQYSYPLEFGGIRGGGESVMQKMTNKHILSNYVQRIVYLDNNQVIEGEYRNFSETKANSGIFKPERIDCLPKTFMNLGLRNDMTNYYGNYYQPEIYFTYDTKGNVKESKSVSGNITTTYLWGYNYQYPIAEIKGATYSEVTGKISESSLNTIAAKSEPTSSDLTTINNLRTQLPKAFVTTYTYKPLFGVEKMTDPLGVVTNYEYDSFGRLKKVTQADKVIESYEYHYKN